MNTQVANIEELKEMLEKYKLSVDDLDDIEVLTACTGTCYSSCGGG